MSTPTSPSTAARRPLCPQCGCSTIRITTAVRVSYDLVFDPSSDDLAVVDARVGDAAWDASNPSECPGCGWSGSVGDLGCVRSR